MRKLLLGAAAVALPVGILASSAGIAGASKAPPVDLSHASVTCTTVTGAAKFGPGITSSGTSPENVNIKLALSGCTASGVSGVTVMSGKGAGILHLASNNATTLFGTNPVLGGHINIKWATSPKPVFKMSTVTVTMITGAVSGNYGSFAVAAGQASVANDFAGSDNGASSSLYVETTQTTTALAASLTASKGLKVVNFGTDGTHLKGNSITLG